MAKKEIESIYELSAQQLGMLSETLAAPNSGIHVEQKVYLLKGQLEISAMKRAWAGLLQRHAALRTGFVWKKQKDPLQVVLRHVELPFAEYDLVGSSPVEQEAAVAEYLETDRRHGFSLSKPPLM